MNILLQWHLNGQYLCLRACCLPWPHYETFCERFTFPILRWPFQWQIEQFPLANCNDALRNNCANSSLSLLSSHHHLIVYSRLIDYKLFIKTATSEGAELAVAFWVNSDLSHLLTIVTIQFQGHVSKVTVYLGHFKYLCRLKQYTITS